MAIEFKKTTSAEMAQYGGDTTVSITVNNDDIGIDDLILVFGDFLKAIGYSPAQVDEWASSYADDEQAHKIGGTSSEDITVSSGGSVRTDDDAFPRAVWSNDNTFYQDEDARLWAEKHEPKLDNAADLWRQLQAEQERQAMNEAYEEYIRNQQDIDLGGS